MPYDYFSSNTKLGDLEGDIVSLEQRCFWVWDIELQINSGLKHMGICCLPNKKSKNPTNHQGHRISLFFSSAALNVLAHHGYEMSEVSPGIFSLKKSLSWQNQGGGGCKNNFSFTSITSIRKARHIPSKSKSHCIGQQEHHVAIPT